MTMADGSNRRLQDHVEYYLFPRLTKRENDEKSIADALEELADRYLAHLSPYLMIYVWQDQPFRLAAVAQTTGESTALNDLHCHTR